MANTNLTAFKWVRSQRLCEMKAEAWDTGLPAVYYLLPQKIEGNSLLLMIASNIRQYT
jgi:hypothetical protein